MHIYDIRVIDELRTFSYNAQGKPEAVQGEHDDCVMALAGAVQLHRRCLVPEDTSWADPIPENKPKWKEVKK